MGSRGRKTNLLRALRFLPPIVWMGLIFYFSSRQRIAVSESYIISFLFFKTLHIIEYGVLFLLWNFALYKNKNSKTIAALISILYGISDELHQRFVPTREGRARDVFIDFLGIIIFWIFVLPRVEKLLKENKLLRLFVFF